MPPSESRPVPSRSVLLVNHTGQVSGAEISLVNLVRGLVEQGVEAAAWVAKPGPLVDRLENLGVSTRVVPLSQPNFRRPLAAVRQAFRVGRLLRAEGVGLVHANSFLAAKALLPATLLARVPLIASVRDIIPFTRMTSRILARCDAVACVSNATAENLLRTFPSGRRHRVTVIYNGVDLNAFGTVEPERARRRLRLDGASRPIVTVLAPIVEWKGQREFLEAARTFVRSAGRGTFVLAGHTEFDETGYADTLRDLTATPELAGRIVSPGFVRDVADLLAATDIVACPSVRPDPLPRAVLEAMAAGRPVIGSAIGGVPEQIEHGVSGLLVPPGDVEELAAALLQLDSRPELCRTLGAAARRTASERFSIDAHVSAFVDLYARVAGPQTS